MRPTLKSRKKKIDYPKYFCAHNSTKLTEQLIFFRDIGVRPIVKVVHYDEYNGPLRGIAFILVHVVYKHKAVHTLLALNRR